MMMQVKKRKFFELRLKATPKAKVLFREIKRRRMDVASAPCTGGLVVEAGCVIVRGIGRGKRGPASGSGPSASPEP